MKSNRGGRDEQTFIREPRGLAVLYAFAMRSGDGEGLGARDLCAERPGVSIERTTRTEATMIIDLLVQVAVSAAVLAIVVLFVIAQDPRGNTRERLLRHATSKHWWNRTHHGP